MTAVAPAGSFEGADVDGLDRLAQEFQQAAQVCDEVKAACEVIVAASWCFGPFGAAFTSYLRTVVIPWLTKIAEALQLMAKVLSAHSQAQRDASSSATSLPSYQTPAGLPSTSTGNYPVLSAAPSTPANPVSVATTTTSYLGGLITVGTDRNGRVVDLTVGGSNEVFADQASVHVDRDAAGNVIASSSHFDEHLGPITSTGSLQTDPIRDASGAIIGGHTSLDATSSVLGTPIIRVSGGDTIAALSDANGNLTDLHQDSNVDLVVGPGTAEGTNQPGSLPGGARIPGLPGGEGDSGLAYHPPELAIGSTSSFGPTYGDSQGASVVARAVGVTYSGSGQDGLLGLGTETKGAVEATGGYFVGSQNWQGHTTNGVLGTFDAGAGVGFKGGAQIGTENTNVMGNAGFGLGPAVGAGGYAVEHDGSYNLGGFGEVDEIPVAARIHHQSEGH